MDEGLPIRENPSLKTTHVNRLISVTWDGLVVTLTWGKATKIAKRLGETPTETVVYVTESVAMPPEIGAETANKLIAVLKAIPGAVVVKPN